MYVEGREGSPSEQGKRSSQGAIRWEMWEAGVETREVTRGETNRAQGGDREVTKDRGEGPSEVRFTDKGKGKEVMEEEETLQEGLEQHNV